MNRTSILIAVGVAGLIACGKSDDKKADPAKTGGAAAQTEQPKGGITAEPVKTIGRDVDVGWGDVAKDLPPHTDHPDRRGPDQGQPGWVSKAGIAQPISGFGSVKQTGFRVAYAPTEKYAAIQQAFQQLQIFEGIANELNKTLKLDRVVDIQMVECGTVNAFYDPNVGRVIMCYELIGYYAEMFAPVAQNNEELEAAILGATIFAFFHELGHGLIHVLDLPRWGARRTRSTRWPR